MNGYLPAIQSEFARKKKSVQNDQADFIDKTIGPRITESFDCSRASIVDKVLSALFDQKIVPNLKEFREKGGTISSLKENLEKELSGCKKKLEDDVERSLHENLNGLYKSSLDSTKYWLEDHGLRMADVGTKLPHCQDGVELVPVNPVSLNTFVHFLNALIVTITGAVVASICGGSGWALILAGPAGLVIGFVIAAVATVPFLLGYRKRFRDLLGRKLSIPSFILKRYALTDKKIEKCRRKLGESLAQEINKQKAQTLAQLKKHLGEVIQDEIDCLSIINVM